MAYLDLDLHGAHHSHMYLMYYNPVHETSIRLFIRLVSDRIKSSIILMVSWKQMRKK